MLKQLDKARVGEGETEEEEGGAVRGRAQRQRVRGRQIAKRLYVLIIIKQNRALHVLIVRQ